MVEEGVETSKPISHTEASNKNNLGMLTVEEYRKRRSNSLLSEPEAVLNEEVEIKEYFKKQNLAYVENIKKLAQLERSMNRDCRMVITIPAYNEGSRIRHTLEEIAKQKIDPSLYEIVIFATPVPDDTTPSEIEDFRKEHPNISLIFTSKPWEKDEPATVGNGRKYAADIALARILERGSNGKDTILLSIDADTIFVEEKYLISILEELDSNLSVDALTTPLGIPQYAMKKPNVAAAFSLLSTFEEIYATGNVGTDRDKIPEPALTNGRSTAVRAAVYSAVGGYNPGAVISEDWELGWIIADARNWDPNRIIYFNKTNLITDPRRFIDAVINRVPTDQQLFDFQTKPELRQLNNDEVLAMVPDSLDWELLQDDVDSIWNSQYSGANMRIGKERFKLIFGAAMKRLGIDFKVDENGRIELISVNRFLEQLAGSNHNIQVVHSKPIKYTPEIVSKIRRYFSQIPIGVIRSRLLRGERIAEQIKYAQEHDENENLDAFLKEYERFTGKKYQST